MIRDRAVEEFVDLDAPDQQVHIVFPGEADTAVHLQSGLRGRLFAAAVLLMPLGLLFHSSFVLEIVLPFMKAMGALECPTGCLN